MALGWISGGTVAIEFAPKCLKFPVFPPVTGNLAENGSLGTGSSAILNGVCSISWGERFPRVPQMYP